MAGIKRTGSPGERRQHQHGRAYRIHVTATGQLVRPHQQYHPCQAQRQPDRHPAVRPDAATPHPVQQHHP